jgi:hypothetical protein
LGRDKYGKINIFLFFFFRTEYRPKRKKWYFSGLVPDKLNFSSSNNHNSPLGTGSKSNMPFLLFFQFLPRNRDTGEALYNRVSQPVFRGTLLFRGAIFAVPRKDKKN